MWPRPHYEPGGTPVLFYAVYGEFTDEFRPSRSRYRVSGLPAGLDVMRYDEAVHPEVRDGFLDGYLWRALVDESTTLADAIERASSCVVLKGTPASFENLDYLRDTVGFLTYLLDSGGVAIYDPLMFRWWSPDDWKASIFDANAPVPHRHVTILMADETGPDNRQWFHTRGMQKFGRPDLSVRGVPASYRRAVISMMNRFIELQAYGGVIPDGAPVEMESLPEGLSCNHGGSVEDPDLSNVHVEIFWPDLSSCRADGLLPDRFHDDG